MSARSHLVAPLAQQHLAAGFFLPAGYEFALLLSGTSLGLVLAGQGRCPSTQRLRRAAAPLAPSSPLAPGDA
jgi:hypothetical protein